MANNKKPYLKKGAS